MDQSVIVKQNSVALIGFHDGVAGQIESWFEEVTGQHLACFVHEAEVLPELDIELENRKRVTKLMEYPFNGSFKCRPLIVSCDWADKLRSLGINKILPLTPDNKMRMKQIAKCREYGFDLISAIHPSVMVLGGTTIEPGVWINAGSLIGYKVEIESGVLVNTGVQIDHHNVLKQCCQVDPGVVTAGNVTLRERCHVHTGVTIINRIEIGQDAIIGAGAVVITNIPPGSTAVGVPAKVIKQDGSSVDSMELAE